MPIVPQKYKSQEIDFGVTPKKLKRNDSNIKILSVQTIPPEKESTSQSCEANLLSATQKDSDKITQFDTTAQSDILNEKKLTNSQKESEFGLTSQAATEFALQKHSNKFELNVPFEIKKPNPEGYTKSLTQNNNGSGIKNPQMCTQTFSENPAQRHFINNNVSQVKNIHFTSFVFY